MKYRNDFYNNELRNSGATKSPTVMSYINFD